MSDKFTHKSEWEQSFYQIIAAKRQTIKNYISTNSRHGGRSNNLGVPEVMWWEKSTSPLHLVGISVRPKPLFWFRSDTETQICRYCNRYRNQYRKHISKGKSSMFFIIIRSLKPNLLPNIEYFRLLLKITVYFQAHKYF